MRRASAVLAALLVLIPLGVRAQTTPVVLELYTSQGCSSCPPADALLTSLSSRDDVIALALHVDYWDYLGWKDNFGHRSYSDRQRAYARAAHTRTIFTPEMVVQGEERIKGHDADRIQKEIAAYADRPPAATLAVARDGDALAIHVAPTGDAAASGPSEVYLVRYIPSEGVSIEAGENAGRDLTYTNIVTSWDTVAHWDGAAPLDLRYEGLGDDHAAVIVQRSHMGPVLTAATVP